jgi:hypothetical protein
MPNTNPSSVLTNFTQIAHVIVMNYHPTDVNYLRAVSSPEYSFTKVESQDELSWGSFVHKLSLNKLPRDGS